MTEPTQMTLPEEGTAMAVDVPSLIQLAIKEDLDVEKLERLIALQERVTDRMARTEFFGALRSFQDECPEIPKDEKADITTKSGGKYGYTFAGLPAIARTVRPILHKHGLSFSWTTEPSEDKSVLNVVCVLRHVAGHEDRSTFPVPTDTSASMSGAQKNGSANTYGHRQSLVSVLGLTATDDDRDGAENPEPITSDQLKTLNELITESGADYKRFLKFLKVENLAEVTQGDYAKADAALRDKIGRTL